MGKAAAQSVMSQRGLTGISGQEYGGGSGREMKDPAYWTGTVSFATGKGFLGPWKVMPDRVALFIWKP